MQKRRFYRFCAMLLLAATMVNLIPFALAKDNTENPSILEPDAEVETAISKVEEPTPDKIGQPANIDISTYGQLNLDEALSNDGQELTRKQNGKRLMAASISLASASMSSSITKSTCVNFPAYTSPYWHCNRYYADGSHANGHYFYASTIAYHTVNGEYAYCLEPNVTSISGATYSGYSAKGASSTSYWMYELDATQRAHIQKILAFGYPSCDYGYGTQAQYAATQVLIWEVITRQRYSDLSECSDYGLYYAVKNTLGNDLYYPYMAILNAISKGVYNGIVPSFASTSSYSPKSVNLTYNSSTKCYEGSAYDSTLQAMSYYTFSYPGVSITRRGNFIDISVPASSAASVKGKTITGVSSQKNMDTSNPTIWENSTYQTVLTRGSAEYMKAYIKLTWTEPSTPTPTPTSPPTPTPTPTPTPEPEPEDGALKIVKKVSDSSIGLSGWKFTISIPGIGTVIRTTNSSGVINISGIPAGTRCTISETGYSGYKALSSQSTTIYEGWTSTVTFTNQPLKGDLTVTKSVNYGTKAGFKFRLHGTSTIGKAVDVTATTNSSGKATFSDIYVGTYTLDEVDPGSTYIKPTSKSVTISANRSTGAAYTSTINMDNVWKHWNATITKTDAEARTAQGDASLEGAEYTLYRSGEAVKVYTIKNGSFTTDLYPCTDSDSVYTLKETKAPPGYELDSTVYKLTTASSHYSAAENNVRVTVSDQVIKGQITLEKWALNTVNDNRQAEKGATFQVWLKSAGSYAMAKDTERDIITISEDGIGTSKDLPYGAYCIQQTTTWEGYDIDETIYEQSISEASGRSLEALTLHNDIWLGTMTVQKVDGDTGAPLAGAEFTLTGTDNSKVELVTDDQGKAIFENLVYGVEYTWAETKPPKGYLLNEANTGTWSVSKHDDAIEITCEDLRRPGSITAYKKDSDDNPLSGCTFLLEYLDGSTWKPVTVRSTSDRISKGGCTGSGLSNGRLTTGTDGAVIFSGLWADSEIQYRLTEVEAPDGYELCKEIIFEGAIPAEYDKSKVTVAPDEVYGNKAYFYELSFTIKDGLIYTLPMTGGNGLPLIPLGAAAMLTGAVTLCLYFRKKHWNFYNRRNCV